MNKYTFTYEGLDGRKIEHKIEEDTCSEVVDAFYHFMLGVSYYPSTVAKVLIEKGQEMLPEEERDNE